MLIDDTHLLADEGFKEKPYQDSLGNWTIGIGFTSLTLDEANVIAEMKLTRLDRQLRVMLYWYGSLSPQVKGVILNMAYQMGVHGLLGFTETLDHIRRGNYQLAANAALNSRWHTQTPNRAEAVAQRLRSANP